MLKQDYIDIKLMPLLHEKGCPLRLIRVHDENHPVWYTLPYDDPDWQYCDAYYVPTQGEVIDWLSDEKKIDITITRYEDKEKDLYFCYNVQNNGSEEFSIHVSPAIYETREAARNNAIKYAFINYIN